MFSKQERVTIFMQRFKGQTNVFPRRWEKWDGSISGYAPVYTDAKKEAWAPYTYDWAEKHLIGSVALGVYPLLHGNISHFIAADFDGDGWKDSVLAFVKICKKHSLPISVERSRSGNGAHAWCFFTEPYPAYKSRKIFIALLREAGVIGQFEKNESFDRLFPNQDYLSGKGLGNLIALPLQGMARKNGNSIFVDPENELQAFEDQWQYLNDIHLVSPEELDVLSDRILDTAQLKVSKKSRKSEGLVLTLSSGIYIEKNDLLPELVSYLREELNLLNIEYLVKERAGLPTYGSPRYINTIQTENGSIVIPRGFLSKLCKWLDEHKIPHSINDNRTACDLVQFNLKTELFVYQKAAIAAFERAEYGVLVAPAGAGKTIIGLALIAQKQQPAIVLTHRRQIYDQWLERIEHGLGIPKTKIGQICSTKKKVLLPITVGMVQTLVRMKEWDDVAQKFGTVIVDECHHMPACIFREVVSKFNGRFLFGLTATPDRKYNDQKLISAYLGRIVHTIVKEELAVKSSSKKVLSTADTVIVHTTNISIPFGTSPRNFPLVSKVISNDASRNALIISDIIVEAKAEKKCLVLTERKEHAQMLRAYVQKDFESILFSGDLAVRQRKLALQKIKSGRFQILIATGQILGEGADIANLDTLFLVFPVSFHGKLAQYVGRIRREGGAKKVYDYRDAHVPLLEKMWKRRATYYRKNNFIMNE